MYPSAWEIQRVRLGYNYQAGSYIPVVTFDLVVGTGLSEPHTSESLQNVRLTVSRNLVNHSIFGRTYVQQCHGIHYTSQDFVRSIVSWNSCSTVSRHLVNHSIFCPTYVQQRYEIRDTSQSIVNCSILVRSTISWILDITQRVP